MNSETKYAFQKRIRELEIQNSKLSDNLYSYRTTLLEIYDEVAKNAHDKAALNFSYILQRIRLRCFK